MPMRATASPDVPAGALLILVLASLAPSAVGAQAPQKSGRPQTAAPSPARAAAERAPTLDVRAALVLPDLTVRSIPLLPLELVAEDDTTRRISIRTGLDGSATTAAAPGRYRLRSLQPTPLGDSTYHWDVAVTLQQGANKTELTNANAVAQAKAASAPRQTARQIAPEREVFERVKRGVFRVEAGLGHGSGFFVAEHGGLVVTNDHVLGNASAASVYIDSVTRVPAQVVARDRDADLALLRLPSSRCAECARLPIARPAGADPLAVAGERVLAIGFPLSQEMTLTTGIVSSVREGAVISDVNLNPGNSGGPMLNLAGEVIAVNTFGDFASQGGPGISGAIAIHKLLPLLERAPAVLDTLPAPEDRLLPVVPRDAYPAALLKAIADTANPKTYKSLLSKDAVRFTVTVLTPVTYRVMQKVAENEVAGDRRKREARAGIAPDQRYSELKQVRDWEQYVGDMAAPVIAVAIEPKIGQTFWSSFSQIVETMNYGTAISQAKLKFQGDVRGARFYRNGVEIEPLRGGHAPQAVLIENRWVQLKDVADMGYYVLPPEAFAPDSAGTPPRVVIAIQDLKNPGSLSGTEIADGASARAWNDFLPYFEVTRPGVPFPVADARKKSPKITMTCDAQTGTCEPKQ